MPPAADAEPDAGGGHGDSAAPADADTVVRDATQESDAGEPVDAGRVDASEAVDAAVADTGEVLDAAIADTGPSPPDARVPVVLPDVPPATAPDGGWPSCDGSRRVLPDLPAIVTFDGAYCVRRRSDGLIIECHDTPEDCVCLGGNRLPEEWECVLRPAEPLCFEYRPCRTDGPMRWVGCYDGIDACRAYYENVIACFDVPISSLMEACVPPDEVVRAPVGDRAVPIPGIGCCYR